VDVCDGVPEEVPVGLSVGLPVEVATGASPFAAEYPAL
jgi:hypothetical protein